MAPDKRDTRTAVAEKGESMGWLGKLGIDLDRVIEFTPATALEVIGKARDLLKSILSMSRYGAEKVGLLLDELQKIVNARLATAKENKEQEQLNLDTAEAAYRLGQALRCVTGDDFHTLKLSSSTRDPQKMLVYFPSYEAESVDSVGSMIIPPSRAAQMMEADLQLLLRNGRSQNIVGMEADRRKEEPRGGEIQELSGFILFTDGKYYFVVPEQITSDEVLIAAVIEMSEFEEGGSLEATMTRMGIGGFTALPAYGELDLDTESEGGAPTLSTK